MSMEHFERPKYLKKNLSQCPCGQHKPYMGWPGFELSFHTYRPATNRLCHSTTICRIPVHCKIAHKMWHFSSGTTFWIIKCSVVIGSKITTVSVTFLVATKWNRRKAHLSMNMFCVVVRKSVRSSSGILLKQLKNTFHFIIDTQPVQQSIFLTVISYYLCHDSSVHLVRQCWISFWPFISVGHYYIYYFSEVMLLIVDESNEYEAWWNDSDWWKPNYSRETSTIAAFSTIYAKVQKFASYQFVTLMFHVSVLKNRPPLQSMCYVDACSSNTGES